MVLICPLLSFIPFILSIFSESLNLKIGVFLSVLMPGIKACLLNEMVSLMK